MRDWVVGGAILLADDGLLLVRNRRRNGSHDWSPPGGVIETHDGESILDGLTREVEEETGLRVTAWEGDLRVDDPDGIVVDAAFVDPAACAGHLDGCHPWVREPLAAWLDERWVEPAPRPFGYRVDGADMKTVVITRL